MFRRILVAALGLFALSACGEGQSNISNTAAPAPEETGDLNAAIGGDELSPIPEAEDDVAANMSGATNLGAGNLVAPLPTPPPVNGQ